MAESNKILVVDDETSLVHLCRIILEKVGYAVSGAYSGSDALLQITKEMPDLVLLDVMMPGMDGIEVCRTIRSLYGTQKPYIVMYTADTTDKTRQSSMDAGADALITKDTPVFELPKKLGTYFQ